MISIEHYFYRKRVVCATLVLLLATAAGFAQSRKKKDKTPRALAVVELPADGKSGARLIPIAILVDGRFWDASVYLADPRPLALDPGNVYEVERSGKLIGNFVVGDAREINDQWTAFGKWEPESAKKAEQPSKPRSADDDEPPILHKSKSEERSQASPTAKAENAPPVIEDPNRPVLRRGKPPAPAGDEDLDRDAKAKPGAKSAAFKVGEVLAAISDAGGPEAHSYAYTPSTDEQQKFTGSLETIARAELVRYTKNLPALKYSPASSFEQVSVKPLDVNYNNNPVVVFTARVPAVVSAPISPRGRTAKAAPQPVPDFWFYVTVVGRNDLYGEMHKLFSSVTDSRHLDAFPRLELIDAVDAESTGRGDLLFRAYARGDSPTYQLYHVGPDSLRKLFDSGGRE